MIIRILGEGQVVLDPSDLSEINELDAAVETAANSGNQAALTEALGLLLGKVREVSSPLPDDVIAESELILPDESATVDQIRELLDESSHYPGLIPE